MQLARPPVPDRPGDRPAVMVLEFHEQAADHLCAGLPGLPPGKAPGHLGEQVRQQRRPAIIGYRGSSGCRFIVVFHKPSMSAAAAPTTARHLACANTRTVTNYSCRISAR